ncbi:MAG: tRNA (adenosine(37)-N6)-threonylcarbamoyltransferase complex transferase subunit TsaD [Parcubacteria group bacterium CG11_big_fil_rev_8_21_14_0_20_39_22]|nr:MAG: tRNA (adenosine(37)-N6)-threonylcarbamoyltransferase complex transferase subunit TsaD [Parcubacteria group bacterium CG11_big_fil_rev_8_21_14_0_20_39_22]
MKILSIETSCDETAVSIIEAKGDIPSVSFKVLADTLLSQVDIHKEYGGVYPNLAKREHSRNLIPLLKKTLDQGSVISNSPNSLISNKIPDTKLKKIGTLLSREPELLKQFLEYIPTISRPDIDAIAVTYGPGLEPALWVGINFAKALNLIWDLPLIAVNHMEGHITSSILSTIEKGPENPIEFKLESPTFPALSILISGGHTEFVLMEDWLSYKIVGETRDDAVGEAFDKIARIMGIAYPGGPEIARRAEIARKKPDLNNPIKLPRPMINSGDLDMSFSGLKTAALYLLRDKEELSDDYKNKVSMETENAIADVLAKKSKIAIDEYGIKSLLVGGGVSANKEIRRRLSQLSDEQGITVYYPHNSMQTDNSLMIGCAGILRFIHEKQKAFTDPSEISAEGSLSFDRRSV